MSGEPLEGAASEAPLPSDVSAASLPKPDDGPRPARTVPRPGGPSRKPTFTGSGPSEPPLAPVGDGPLPKLPEIEAALAAADGSSLPELRALSSADGPSSSEGTGPPRRRSRRTVKIPADAVPHKATPPVSERTSAPPESTPPVSAKPVAAPVSAPPVAAPVSAPPVSAPPVAASTPVSTPAPAVASFERPATSDRPPLLVIPPSPPVPTLTPRSVVPRPNKPVESKPVEEVVRPAEEPAPPPAETEVFEVIQPMRIISIGSSQPPEPLPAPAVDDAGWDDAPPREGSPLAASPDAEAVTLSAPPVPSISVPPVSAPPPVPRAKPPAVEEVEAIEDEETDVAAAAAPTLRTEEIESIPDDEIVADRLSTHDHDHDHDHEEIAIDVVEAPAPKKPPPPPPKRVEVSTPTSTRAPEAAPPSGPPLAQTIDLGNRKRQKPWWEEVFSDDYLRTMEKPEAKVIRKECDFIEDRLGLEKGAVMLDLACGAGAHAVELAGRGYNVVGYDLSLAMLAQAQDEALDRGQKINFLHGDMREMAFEEAFDGIYCWNTSFGYFDDEKNLNVLSRIRRGLRQGGLCLLDVANRDYVCPRQPSLVWFEGDGCVCMDEMHVDFFSSRLRVKRTVMFEDGRARECDYGIRLYGLHELGKMLHETGFKVVEVTGHPAHPGVFFGSESPRIIVLAERA